MADLDAILKSISEQFPAKSSNAIEKKGKETASTESGRSTLGTSRHAGAATSNYPYVASSYGGVVPQTGGARSLPSSVPFTSDERKHLEAHRLSSRGHPTFPNPVDSDISTGSKRLQKQVTDASALESFSFKSDKPADTDATLKMAEEFGGEDSKNGNPSRGKAFWQDVLATLKEKYPQAMPEQHQEQPAEVLHSLVEPPGVDMCENVNEANMLADYARLLQQPSTSSQEDLDASLAPLLSLILKQTGSKEDFGEQWKKASTATPHEASGSAESVVKTYGASEQQVVSLLTNLGFDFNLNAKVGIMSGLMRQLEDNFRLQETVNERSVALVTEYLGKFGGEDKEASQSVMAQMNGLATSAQIVQNGVDAALKQLKKGADDARDLGFTPSKEASKGDIDGDFLSKLLTPESDDDDDLWKQKQELFVKTCAVRAARKPRHGSPMRSTDKARDRRKRSPYSDDERRRCEDPRRRRDPRPRSRSPRYRRRGSRSRQSPGRHSDRRSRAARSVSQPGSVTEDDEDMSVSRSPSPRLERPTNNFVFDDDTDVFREENVKMFTWKSSEWRQLGVGCLKLQLSQIFRNVRVVAFRYFTFTPMANHWVTRNVEVRKMGVRTFAWYALDFADNMTLQTRVFAARFTTRERMHDFMDVWKQIVAVIAPGGYQTTVGLHDNQQRVWHSLQAGPAPTRPSSSSYRKRHLVPVKMSDPSEVDNLIQDLRGQKERKERGGPRHDLKDDAKQLELASRRSGRPNRPTNKKPFVNGPDHGFQPFGFLKVSPDDLSWAWREDHTIIFGPNSKKYSEFSNFFVGPTPIEHMGRVAPSVEHHFQYAFPYIMGQEQWMEKFISSDNVKNPPISPEECYTLGRECRKRHCRFARQRHALQVYVLRSILLDKFLGNSKLMELLAETGDAQLWYATEDRDMGIGWTEEDLEAKLGDHPKPTNRNLLGQLLAEIRYFKLNSALPPTVSDTMVFGDRNVYQLQIHAPSEPAFHLIAWNSAKLQQVFRMAKACVSTWTQHVVIFAGGANIPEYISAIVAGAPKSDRALDFAALIYELVADFFECFPTIRLYIFELIPRFNSSGNIQGGFQHRINDCMRRMVIEKGWADRCIIVPISGLLNDRACFEDPTRQILGPVGVAQLWPSISAQ